MKKTLFTRLLLLVLLFSGCSDDDSSRGDNGGQTLPRFEFVEKAPNVIFSIAGNEYIKENSDINGLATISFDYINGYGQDARISVREIHECITADMNVTLAAKEVKSNITIPLQGTPNEEGETEITISVMVNGSTVAVDTYSLTILDKEGTIPVLAFGDFTKTGTFVKDVALSDDAMLTLAYTGALNQIYNVAVAEVSGISSASQTITLVSGAGSIDIPLTGTPTAAGDLTLVVTLTPESGEATTKDAIIEVSVQNPLTFSDATITGKITETIPVADYTVILNYTNGLGRSVTPVITSPSESGLTATIENTPLTLEAESGTISVIISGDSPVIGTHNYSITFTYDGDGSAISTFDIEVEEKSGAIFEFAKTSFKGIPLVNGAAIGADETSLLIPYSSGFGSSVNIEVSGQATSAAADYILDGDNGVVEISLSGTPANELGDLVITIDATVTTINSVFAGEKVVFEGLNYYTVFADLNSNDIVDSGERWLDRNLGAISNDPGKRGDFNQNDDALGHYYHYGKAYNEHAELEWKTKNGSDYYNFAKYTSGFSFPGDLNWEICPEGYRRPTREEFGMVGDKYLGTTYKNNPNNIWAISRYANPGNGTQPVMDSPLRFAMGGLMIGKEQGDVPGAQTAFWTSSLVDNDKNTVRIFFQGDQIDIGHGNDVRANIRCLKK